MRIFIVYFWTVEKNITFHLLVFSSPPQVRNRLNKMLNLSQIEIHTYQHSYSEANSVAQQTRTDLGKTDQK